MTKFITILAIILICHGLVAEVTPQFFQTVDDLIVHIKEEDPTYIHYDTNGIIVGVKLPLDCCIDPNLHLLSTIKSIKYLRILGFGGYISTNAISALAEFPNLTNLDLICCGG